MPSSGAPLRVDVLGPVLVVDAASRAVVASLETGNKSADTLVFAGGPGVVVASVARDLRAWSVAALKIR